MALVFKGPHFSEILSTSPFLDHCVFYPPSPFQGRFDHEIGSIKDVHLLGGGDLEKSDASYIFADKGGGGFRKKCGRPLFTIPKVLSLGHSKEKLDVL